MKETSNPVITEELREWRGRAIPLEGEKIHNVIDGLHREYINVEGKVDFKRGQYNGMRSMDTKRFPIVGVRTEDADDYRLYMTKLPREESLPEDLSMLYRCRWEVEFS